MHRNNFQKIQGGKSALSEAIECISGAGFLLAINRPGGRCITAMVTSVRKLSDIAAAGWCSLLGRPDSHWDQHWF